VVFLEGKSLQVPAAGKGRQVYGADFPVGELYGAGFGIDFRGFSRAVCFLVVKKDCFHGSPLLWVGEVQFFDVGKSFF
jgi:hypothetical protein